MAQRPRRWPSLCLAEDHDKDGDSDEAEGDPHPDEGPEDGRDDKPGPGLRGVDVDPALGELGLVCEEGGVVPGADARAVPGPHTQTVFLTWLQSIKTPVSSDRGQVPDDVLLASCPPDLQQKGDGLPASLL